MITSVLILPPLEYFVQFFLSDLTSIYCTLIDYFKAELIFFNILPENEVHFNWMLRARGYSVQYGTSHLSNQNYNYDIAQKSIDTIIRDFFQLRCLFRIFISDVLTINGTSPASTASLPVFYEPFSEEQRHRLCRDEGGLCSEFLAYLERSISQPNWNLSHFSAAHFAHRRRVQVHRLVQFPELFDYSYFSKISVVIFPLIWHILYLDFYRALSSAALLNEDNVAHWLCYGLGYTDWSKRIAFDQMAFFSPCNFSRDSTVSTVVHLLYSYSGFLCDPFQVTPLRSPDCHLFSAATAYKELILLTLVLWVLSARSLLSLFVIKSVILLCLPPEGLLYPRPLTLAYSLILLPFGILYSSPLWTRCRLSSRQ